MPFAASSRALLVAFPVLLFAACSSAALPDVAPDAAQDAAGGDGAADAPDAALPADAASADATLAEGGPASDAAVSDAGAPPDASVLDAAAPPPSAFAAKLLVLLHDRWRQAAPRPLSVLPCDLLKDELQQGTLVLAAPRQAFPPNRFLVAHHAEAFDTAVSLISDLAVASAAASGVFH